MKYQKLLFFMLIVVLGCNLVGNAQTNLEKIYEFPNGETGHGMLNNSTNVLLINQYTINGDKRIIWYSNKKVIKEIKGVEEGSFSPNGMYYFYIKNGILLIFNDKGNLMSKFQKESYSGGIEWSKDSKYIFLDAQEGLYKFDIKVGTAELIQKPKRCFHPVAVNNPNVIYLLKPRILAADSDCDIIKYDLITKKIQLIELPRSLCTFDDFTISPDEKIVILQYGSLYVIDLMKNIIIDKIFPPGDASVFGYSWCNNSSLTFTMISREIYKYTIPATASVSTTIELEKLLSSDYAKNIQQNPGNKELPQEEKQKEIDKANALSEEGFTNYKAHNDVLAVAKYEEALTHYATAEIYYRIGNSLSNIDQLKYAIKAYQIAIDLNYDKIYLAYYNLACAYSRLHYGKQAFSNLELAINNGYKNISYIEKDSDLTYLRSTPEWNDWWAKHKK